MAHQNVLDLTIAQNKTNNITIRNIETNDPLGLNIYKESLHKINEIFESDIAIYNFLDTWGVLFEGNKSYIDSLKKTIDDIRKYNVKFNDLINFDLRNLENDFSSSSFVDDFKKLKEEIKSVYNSIISSFISISDNYGIVIADITKNIIKLRCSDDQISLKYTKDMAKVLKEMIDMMKLLYFFNRLK